MKEKTWKLKLKLDKCVSDITILLLAKKSALNYPIFLIKEHMQSARSMVQITQPIHNPPSPTMDQAQYLSTTMSATHGD